MYLVTVRSQLAVQPIPSIFLQTYGWSLLPPINGQQPRSATGKLVYIALDWREPKATPDSVPTGESLEEIPILLVDVVRHDSPWPWLSDTQVVDLITKIVTEIDFLPKSLFFAVSLYSVLITNPSRLGTDKPLSFRFCPFSLGMEKELPQGLTRHQVARRSTSRFILHLATRLEDLNSPLLKKRMAQAFTRSPGLITAFQDLWGASNPDPRVPNLSSLSSAFGTLSGDAKLLHTTEMANRIKYSEQTRAQFAQSAQGVAPPSSGSSPHTYSNTRSTNTTNASTTSTASIASLASATPTPTAPTALPATSSPSIPHDAKMIDFSPSILVFTFVRSKERREFKIEQVPGLLSAIRCHDSPTMHSTAVDGLWRFILGATKSHLADAIGIITQCISALVPAGKTTGLTDPSSSSRSAPWILRMNIIDRALFENERSGDYSRLRTAQQTLLEAGIGSQLGGSLVAQNTKFTLKVLMPVVRVSTLASFHFPVLGVRLIFDRNVRKMCKMCFDAEPRGDIHHTDRDRFVSMMLVMSDFKRWCGNTEPKVDKHADMDVKLMELWDKLDEDTFLLYALPCWNQSIGDATTAAIVKKLEAAFYSCSQVYIHSANKNEQEVLKKKLMYILDWLVQFAWNAPEQVNNASYQSLYTSHFLALIFRKPAQSIFFDAPATRNFLLLNEVEDADTDERMLLPNMVWEMPQTSLPAPQRPDHLHHQSQQQFHQSALIHRPPTSEDSSSEYDSAHLSAAAERSHSLLDASGTSLGAKFVPPAVAQVGVSLWSRHDSQSPSTGLEGGVMSNSFGLNYGPILSGPVNLGSSIPHVAGKPDQNTFSLPSYGASPLHITPPPPPPHSMVAPVTASAATTQSTSAVLAALAAAAVGAATSPSSSSFGSTSALGGQSMNYSSSSNSTSSAIHDDVRSVDSSASSSASNSSSSSTRSDVLSDPFVSHPSASMPHNVPSSQEPRQHPLFPHAVEVPFVSSSDNIQAAIEFMDTLEPANPEGLAYILHTFKFAVIPRNLYGFVKRHQDASLSKHYAPTPGSHGAPTSEDLAFLNFPSHRNDFMYHENNASLTRIAPPEGSAPISTSTEGKYSSIRSLLFSEMQIIDPNYKKFEPITLATANHRLCHTKAQPVQGTTGMMDVRIVDSGETNDIMIGLTWNLEADSNMPGGLDKIVPGRTPYSVGLAVSTGHVYFLDKDGKRSKLPYTVPCGTTSRLCIGIAYNKIYFVLDNVFYPPLPDFSIPDGCDIHGLVRFGCGGIKLTSRSLTNRWSLERHLDGTLKETKSNPVAHSLYLAELRTKVCPHYHAHRRAKEARPHLMDMKKDSEDYRALPEEARELIDRVHLACIECVADACPAPKYLRDKIQAIISTSGSTTTTTTSSASSLTTPATVTSSSLTPSAASSPS